ncbi:MAG: cupredoxin domain-containing protein [Dehalococcoidia bacterium]|nr:cupredoxin domain-containing protein [Dehalococcoidia bacterium]
MIPHSGLRRFALLLLLLSLSALLALSYACGDDDDGGDGSPAPTTSADGGDGAGGDGQGADQEFELTMGDNSFEPTEFTVGGGKTITLRISNSGTAIHNVRLAGADNEFITDDDSVSLPTLVYGAETAKLDWIAPGGGGAFDFRCDFHPAAMAGKIIVEPSNEPSDVGGEGP